MNLNSSNVTEEIQTWIVFCSFLVCSLRAVFRTNPENVLLESIMVQSLEKNYNWKLPFVFENVAL